MSSSAVAFPALCWNGLLVVDHFLPGAAAGDFADSAAAGTAAGALAGDAADVLVAAGAAGAFAISVEIACCRCPSARIDAGEAPVP